MEIEKAVGTVEAVLVKMVAGRSGNCAGVTTVVEDPSETAVIPR
jgi:hypothetical protein